MDEPVRRGGRYLDDGERTVTWSIADGSRGRRWRWTVVDRRGSLVATHTLETDPDGRFLRLESATAPGLLSLHREPDGSVHGNRIGERGIDHLTIPAPAPEGVVVGGSGLGVAALLGGIELPAGRLTLDVVEVFEDLGVRIAACTLVPNGGGGWEVRTNRLTRRVRLGADGLPADGDGDAVSWPLEER